MWKINLNKNQHSYRKYRKLQNCLWDIYLVFSLLTDFPIVTLYKFITLIEQSLEIEL